MSIEHFWMLLLLFVFLPIIFSLIFLLSIKIFLDKDDKKEIIEYLKTIFIKIKKILIPEFHDVYGSFSRLTFNIIINLEKHKYGKVKEIIDNVIGTIIHEDLHKSFRTINNTTGEHWAIDRLI